MTDLNALIRSAVDAMRDGSDEAAVRSLLALATLRPQDVVERLLQLVSESDRHPHEEASATNVRLPSGAVARSVLDLANDGDAAGLWHLGGASYDGLVALLIGTLARATETAGGPSPWVGEDRGHPRQSAPDR